MSLDILSPINFLETPTVNGETVLSGPALTGITAGTYRSLTVGPDGRATAGTNPNAAMQSYYTGTVSAQSGTTIIPADATVPLSTEGTQLWAQTLTPASVSSRFAINQTFMCDSNTNNRNIIFAIFRNTTCIYATCINVGTAGRPQSTSIYTVDSPASSSSITYSLRVGVSAAATWYINQSNLGAITFGGSANRSDWGITEIS